VIRIVFLLCLCLAAPALGQEPAGTGFDVDAMSNVQTEAMDFMLPRTLEAVTAAQLAIWGLGGLTAIDPGVTALARDTKIQLLVRGRSVSEVAAQGTEAASWAQAIAKIVSAGWVASSAIRQAGQPAVTKVLFDEMLAHLDPYSRYIPPMEAVGDRDRRVGHAGIGVTLAQHGHAVTVRDVVIGSPGALAGIRPGDVIQWVDGHTALGKDRVTIEALLNGPEGTELQMGWHGRDSVSRGATLTRVMIPPETVFPRRNGDVAIIQITGFSQTTDQHVIQVLRDYLKGPRPVTGIVLDLRGNRGGLVRAAVATADSFLPAGVIMRSSGRAPETNRVWLSGGGELAKGVRMVVLVDGGTASAAEILAAALADRGRAVIVGSSTFGKGVVQTIDPLPDGGELFLTWSRILAPRFWPIQSLGVFPQVCTSLGDDALHRQLAALADGKVAMADAIQAHRAARAPLSPDQIVAIRGRCPASDPRVGDEDVAEALVEAPASYGAALLPPMADEH
jgi:carboxyl-terminal processing protease